MKLNKSMYKSYQDCPLKGYYEKTGVKKTNENETYMVFYNYGKLKEIATKYMMGMYRCIDITKHAKYFSDKIRETHKYLQQGTYECIINACIDNGPIQGQIDFLVKSGDEARWSPVIVKSAEDIKENVGIDAAYVKALLDGKYEIDKIYIISVNKSAVKTDTINSLELISISSKFDGKELVDFADEFAVNLAECEMYLNSTNRPRFTGCKNCKYCEWRDVCVKSGFLPEYGTLDIIYGRDTAYKHFKNGCKLIKDVPYDEEFDLRQTAQIYCEKNPNKMIFEPKKIKHFLKGLKEPYHFMDFEALNTLVPRLRGTHPFEFVPYQYSLHQTMKDLKIYNHDEFLSFDMDCRKEFLDRLLDSLGEEGSIIVWNQEFEESRMNELAEQFPEYRKRISKLRTRYFDLMIPFEKLWLYKPEMYGKYSLKYVFPALSDAKSYSDLNVKNGLQTMILFFKILKEPAATRNQLINQHKDDMLAYCSLDTESMIFILDEMQKMLKNLPPKESYVSLDAMKTEVREEQLNRRFKDSKIPTILTNIINNLLINVATENIDEEGYTVVTKWMEEHRIKDYVPSDKSDEIRAEDIVYYWDSLPMESNNETHISKNKLLRLVGVSRFAIENPNSSNILKMSTIINVSKAKKAENKKTKEKEKTEEQIIANIEDIEDITKVIDEDISKLDISEIDVNNPDINIEDVSALIDNLEVPTEEDVEKYESLSDILDKYNK